MAVINPIMRNHFVGILWILLISFTFVSCHKEDLDSIDPNAKNTVAIEFDNRVGDQKLILGTPAYKNASGEPFSLTTFNYFISNISLKKEDGSLVKFPNQYFLVRQADSKTQTIQLTDVPAGNHGELSFTIGVDSLKKRWWGGRAYRRTGPDQLRRGWHVLVVKIGLSLHEDGRHFIRCSGHGQHRS